MPRFDIANFKYDIVLDKVMVFEEIADFTSFISNKYIQSALIFLIFLVITLVVILIINPCLRKIAVKTKSKADDMIIERISDFLVWIFFLIGIRIALEPLHIRDIIVASHVLDSLTIAIVTYVVMTLVDIIIDEYGKKIVSLTAGTKDDELLPLFHMLAQIIIVIIGIIFILKEWEVNLTPVLASLGIAGIIVGLALKDSLANIFGGMSLILDKNFKVDDLIVVGSPSGEIKGKVLEIGVRSTKIKTFDNESIIIPNASLANSNIINYSQPDVSVRGVVKFNLVYGTDPDKVRKVVLEEIHKIDKVLKDPAPTVDFTEMADSWLAFRATFWVAHYTERFSVRMKATALIYKALNKNKIGFAYPTQTVYLQHEKKKRS